MRQGGIRPGALRSEPLRFYEQVDRNPGSPPRIITLTNKDDLTAMIDDIAKTKSSADVVIISMHWGVHYVPALIAMYQREIAHAAIDAGADLILGHHPHILKGIETYKGKVVFYSLGNFVMPAKVGHVNPTKIFYDVKVDDDYRFYPYPVDCRKTMIAKCSISNKSVSKVSYLARSHQYVERSPSRYPLRISGATKCMIIWHGVVRIKTCKQSSLGRETRLSSARNRHV